MNSILIIGAGRSTFSLVEYLLERSKKFNWKLTIADNSEDNLEAISGDDYLIRKKLNILNEKQRRKLIQEHDVVLSMLPPALHFPVVEDCLALKKHFLSASYETPDIKKLEPKVKKEKLFFLNEMGLDPGIDHMSAMKVISELKSKQAKIVAFRSYTGALISPESDNNPWHYKISWNPLNVVMAGQHGAMFLAEGNLKLVPHHKIFERLGEVKVEGLGEFDGYFNRNSVPYKSIYGLKNIDTLIRGTLRNKGFCSSWNQLVKLGIPNNHTTVDYTNKTYNDYTRMFLPSSNDTTDSALRKYLGLKKNDPEYLNLEWLGLLSDKPLPFNRATPADVLKELIKEKWRMKEDDKDWVVMIHQIHYKLKGEERILQSFFDMKGIDNQKTALAKTVGLPLGIATDLLMNGKINLTGIHIPVKPEIYGPVLDQLRTEKIIFKEIEK